MKFVFKTKFNYNFIRFLKRKKFKTFFYSVLKNFSFFYNNFYFKLVKFKIKNKKKIIKFKKIHFLKKWIFFLKNFKFLKKKRFYTPIIYQILTKLLFKFFFKRLGKKIILKEIKNPLFIYQKKFKFKIIKLLFYLRSYNVFSRVITKKKFYFKLLIEIYSFLKNLMLKFPPLKPFLVLLKKSLNLHGSYLRFKKLQRQGLVKRSKYLYNSNFNSKYKNQKKLNFNLRFNPNYFKDKKKKKIKIRFNNKLIFKKIIHLMKFKFRFKKLNFKRKFINLSLKLIFERFKLNHVFKKKVLLIPIFKNLLNLRFIYKKKKLKFNFKKLPFNFFFKFKKVNYFYFLKFKKYLKNNLILRFNKFYFFFSQIFYKKLKKKIRNSLYKNNLKLNILNKHNFYKIKIGKNKKVNLFLIQKIKINKKQKKSKINIKKINKKAIKLFNLKNKNKKICKIKNFLFNKKINKCNSVKKIKVIIKKKLKIIINKWNSVKRIWFFFRKFKRLFLRIKFFSKFKIFEKTNPFCFVIKKNIKINLLKKKYLISYLKKKNIFFLTSNKKKKIITGLQINKRLNFRLNKHRQRRNPLGQFFYFFYKFKENYLKKLFYSKYTKIRFYRKFQFPIIKYSGLKKKKTYIKNRKISFSFNSVFNFKKKNKFISIYFFNINFLKKLNLKLLYKFFLLRQKIKFLNNFKKINKSLILNFKWYKFKKKFFLQLNYFKKKVKLKKKKIKLTSLNFINCFKKYQSFKKYKKVKFKFIPVFFLHKKPWKQKNLKFKINQFITKFFRFRKSQKKKKFQNDFKRFGNFRRCFDLKLKFLWDKKTFLNFQRLRNKVWKKYNFKKLNYLLKTIINFSFFKIFYVLLLKNKKKDIIFFNLLLKKKNFILFLKNKLLKKSFFLIKNFLNFFFLKGLQKKIRFLFFKKKMLIYKKLILKWFLKKNFLLKNKNFILNKNSNFYFLFKTKFKNFYLKNFFKINFIWTFLFKKIKNFYYFKNNFKYLFFIFKNSFLLSLNLKSIKNFLKSNIKFSNFFIWTKKTRYLKYKKIYKVNLLKSNIELKRKNKLKPKNFFFFTSRKIPIKKIKTLFFNLRNIKKKIRKFLPYLKKKNCFLNYNFKKCFSYYKRSFWSKTKYFFQKLLLSFYLKLNSYKKSIQSLILGHQLFYSVKISFKGEIFQDKDFSKRKIFNFRKFNVHYKKRRFKKFLLLKNFSKKIYLYKRFFKYLKSLKKIKNQFFFKKKKFIEIFFLRLDIFLSEFKFLGNLKTVRQLISLNYIYLNLKIETRPNFFLKLLDIVTVCKKINSWLNLVQQSSKIIKTKLIKWPIFTWSFKQNFEFRYKTKKILYEFKLNIYGLGLVITSNLKFKFRKFKKESIFIKNLSLHEKQILFLLNSIKR